MIVQYRPVFIVAPVRSGSTFLRLMLDAHPNLSNPGECDFLFDLIDSYGTCPDTGAYHEWLSLNRIFQDKKLKINNELSYLELIFSFIEQLTTKDSVLSLNIHRDFEKIPMVFPAAKYIHLLRDPRDVAKSCVGMGWVGNVYYGVDIWEDAERSWDKLKDSLKPDQYIEIKYEDLLQDVEKTLTKVCNFLGVLYSPQMMDYADTSNYDLPDKKLSYQWRRKYSKHELQLVEDKISKLLLDRNYELSKYDIKKTKALTKLYLMIQNKIFKIKYQTNKYGIALYVKKYIANKMGIVSLQTKYKEKTNIIDIKGLK